MISDLLRRWKQSRRISRAEAEISSRKMQGAPHGLAGRLIISLTSYPARFASLHLVLQSLLNQSVKADEVVLWLDAGDEAQMTPQMRALVASGALRVAICPRWRSYKKLVPMLLEAPHAYIVTADDDVYYGADWLAGLVSKADAGVVCHRGHRITLSDAGQPRSYEDWQRNLAQPECGRLIFPTGVGGVLYAPGVFHDDVCNFDMFQQLAPSADDVWFYWMHRLAGSNPCKIGGRFRITEWPGTQQQNLRSGNLAGASSGESGNDRALRALVDKYGFPG